MAEAIASTAQAGAQAYFTTSYAPGGGTTSTAALSIWRALSRHLIDHSLPLTGAELSEATGLSVEELERIFSQTYYKRWYGFRRFDTLEEWRSWAMSTGVLYNPELHDRQPEEEPAEDEDDEESDPDAEDEE